MAFTFAREVRRTQRAKQRYGCSQHPSERNFTWIVLVPADGTCAATCNEKNGDFGTSPIYGQLSDKPLLAFVLLLNGARREAQGGYETRRLRLGRFRLRGPRGAQDEFTLGAIA